jgi:DNA-binding transcriptional regulator YiaG
MAATHRNVTTFAASLGTERRTVQRWLDGSRGLTGPVRLLLRLLRMFPGLIRPINNRGTRRKSAPVR